MLCLMHCPCNTCARCIALAHKPGQSQSLAHVCPIFHHIGLLHCPAILAAPQHSTRRSSGARGPTARQRHSLRPRCLSRCQLQYSKLAMARHKSSRTPLRDRALAALATCMPRLNPHPRSVWVEGRSLPIRLRVYNQLPADVVQVRRRDRRCCCCRRWAIGRTPPASCSTTTPPAAAHQLSSTC